MGSGYVQDCLRRGRLALSGGLRGPADVVLALDEAVYRGAGDGLGDEVEGEVVYLREVDAGLAHVELLPRGAVAFAEPFVGVAVAVDSHEVEGHVVLLGGEGGV